MKPHKKIIHKTLVLSSCDLFLFMSVVFLVHHTHAWRLQRPEVGSLETGDCELSCGCWGLNLLSHLSRPLGCFCKDLSRKIVRINQPG